MIQKQKFYLKMVSNSLIRGRSRMIAALLAVIVGATTLSGLLTIYYDLSRQMSKEFRSYGANLILIPPSGASSVSYDDFNAAVSLLPEKNVVGVTPYRYRTVKVNEQPFMAAGTDFNQAQKTSPYWYVSGDFPKDDKHALIGKEVADRIRLAAGSGFEIVGLDAAGVSFRREFKVSGIVQTGGQEEEFIFMTLNAFNSMTNSFAAADIIECSITASSQELDALSKQIDRASPALNARQVKRISESEGLVLSKLKALVWIVNVVVLLLTMICVATTMLAVVAERRKEIGLKKALGASDKSIMAEFLGEDAFLGCLGGLLGTASGFCFAYAIAVSVFARPVTFQPF
ncbi:MAG: ABC transporter permease, partial [Endomicrobium sp.]|nr:ABC transporter permease [Endomicrobium sp.]